MDASIQKMIESLANSGTRSGERLIILSGFVHTLSPEKVAKLKTLAVDWKTLEGELVPLLNLEFFS